MEIRASTAVDRPVEDVWRWYAEDHVRNHPRWDPDMELEQLSDGPIGVGTKIRRRNTRWGAPVEGEMEIIEWEPRRVFGATIRDANMEMSGRAIFEPTGDDRTVITVATDIPGLEEPEQAEHMTAMMQRSLGNVKQLIESET